MFGLSEEDLQVIDSIIEGHNKEFDKLIAANNNAEIEAWLTDVAYEGSGG